MVDGAYEPVDVADRFLRDLRLAGARAESTTKAYAGDVALFLNWCAETDRTLEVGLRQLGRFQLWLQTTPIERRGRGVGNARGPRRINRILVAVRELANTPSVMARCPPMCSVGSTSCHRRISGPRAKRRAPSTDCASSAAARRSSRRRRNGKR